MSPEQWLAQQGEASTPQNTVPSPEQWLAQQKPEQPEQAAPSPEEWLAQQQKAEKPAINIPGSDVVTGAVDWLKQQANIVGTGLEIGAKNTKSAILNNQIAGIAEVQEARKSQYGSVENMPEDVREKYIKDQKAIESKLKETGDISAEVSQLRQAEGRTSTQNFFQLQQTPEYKNADFWDKTKMVGGALMEDPLGIITDLGLESLPASLAVAAPALLVGVATRNPEAAAITGGAASAMTEFGNQYVDLRAQGMPHGEAWEKAGVKSGVIGLFDGLSFRSAGKAAGAVVREIETGAKEGLLQGTKEILKETGKQAAYGGAGEALGSVAASQEIDPGQVLAEAVGEVFGAPGEAVSTYRSQQQEATLRKALLGEEPVVPQVEVIGQPGVQAPAEERVEPEIAGPIEEAPTPEASPEQQLYDETFTRFRELGLNENLAAEQAAAAVKEAQDAGEFGEPVAGTVEPSVSVPIEQGRAEPGVEKAPSEGLGMDTTGVQGVDVRKVAEQPALEETPLKPLTPEQKTDEVNSFAGGIRDDGVILDQHNEPLIFARGDYTPDVQQGAKPPEVSDGALGPGFYVTQDQAAAASYAPYVTPFTVQMKNPLVLRDVEGSRVAEAIAQDAKFADENFNTRGGALKWARQQYEDFSGIGDPDFQTMLRDAGYDGVILYKGDQIIEAMVPTAEQVQHRFTPEQQAALTKTTPEAAPIETPVAEAPVVTKGKRGRPAKTAEEKALTAERAAQRKLERKESGRTKLLNDARYKLNNAITYIQTPDVNADIFPKTPEGQAALQTARNELQAKQVTGAKDIYKIAHDPALKGTPNQKKAMGLWEKFTPQEKRAVEAMVKEEAIGPSRAEIGAATESGLVESTDGRENGAYLTLNNPVQALSYIRKTGNEFEKALAQRISPFLQGTKLVIVHDITDVPKNVRAKFKGAVGMYDNVTRTIYLSAEGGLNNTVFLHEAVHGATIARINQFIKARNAGTAIPKNIALAMQELESLMQRSKNFYSILKSSPDTLTADQKRIVDNMDEFLRVEAFDDVKEFVAYGFTHPAFQQFLYILPGRIKGEAITKANGFTKFVDSVRRILGMDDKHDSALQDLIAITDTLIGAPAFKGPDVSKVEETLPAKARTKKIELDRDQEKVRASVMAANTDGVVRALTKIAKEGHNFEDYKAVFNAVFDGGTVKALSGMLKSMQTTDILRWKGDEIAGLYEIDKFQQLMAAMHEHLKVGATKKAEALGEFVRKHGQKVIGEAMHLARLKKFSPQMGVKLDAAVKNDVIVKHYDKLLASETDPKKVKTYTRLRSQRRNDIAKVYKTWDALGKQKNGQEMYVMVRDFYRDNYDASRRILNEQLDKLPIDDDAKARLLKSVRLMYEQGKTADTEEFVDETGQAIKVPRSAEDYFPFRRYGEYWLNIKGPKGREFYLFESPVERNLFQEQRAKDLGVKANDGDVFSRGDGAKDLRRKIHDSSMMLQKMFADIESMKPTKAELAQDPQAFDAYKEQLKDQLYQTYLMTLPERSFRKQFLHAEEVTGFSADVFRNFKVTASMYANQLAKLKYGVEIEEQIQRAFDYLERAEPAQAERDRVVIKEIAQRAREEINPTPVNKAVTIANQFAYYWLLTSGASAATQFLSVPMVVMPKLVGQYGTVKASMLLGKYLKVWNTIGAKETLPGGEKAINISFGTSASVKNNPLLKAAFDAAVDRHVTTITNTSVLTDQGATPERVAESNLGLVGRAPVTALRAMGSLFSGAERLTREMTYLMAFEAEYAKNGGNFDAAVDKAITTTYDTLGRYDSFNRATIMRNAVGRTVGQFKQYAYTMTSFFVRNMYNTVRLDKSLTAPERKEAIASLTGTLAMGWLFAGVGGLPAFSSFCFLIDVLLDAFGDEDEDKKKRRAETPFFADDFKSRFTYEWLPSKLGQITVPGIDGRQHKMSDIMMRGPVSVLSDIDFGSRVGWDNMWFRSGKVQPTMAATLGSYTEEMLGPAYSGIKTVLGGVDDLAKGDFLRGLEGISPAALRAPIAATRMATEGAETRKGEDILRKDELNALNIVMKGIGYSPTRLTQLQQYRFALNQQIQAARSKHNELLGALNKAAFDEEGSAAKVKSAVEDIEKFNKRYPGVDGIYIDLDTIDRSMDTYAERKGLTYRGVYLDDKLLPYIGKSLQGANPPK